MDILTVVEELRGILNKMDAGDFCGCYEGDMDNRYPDAIESVCKELDVRLRNIVKSQANKKRGKIK